MSGQIFVVLLDKFLLVQDLKPLKYKYDMCNVNAC